MPRKCAKERVVAANGQIGNRKFHARGLATANDGRRRDDSPPKKLFQTKTTSLNIAKKAYNKFERPVSGMLYRQSVHCGGFTLTGELLSAIDDEGI